MICILQNKEKYIEKVRLVLELLLNYLKKFDSNYRKVVCNDLLPFFESLNDKFCEKILDNEMIEIQNTINKSISISSFLLYQNIKINDLSYYDIVYKSQEEFNDLDLDIYLPYIFPCEGQVNPSLTNSDINAIKDSIGRFRFKNSVIFLITKLFNKYNIVIESGEILECNEVDRVSLEYLCDILDRAYDFHKLINKEEDLLSDLEKLKNNTSKLK